MKKGIDTALALSLLEKMVTIRRLEETLKNLFAESEIKGLIHLSIGQEAVPTGVCANLRTDDYITSTHRGHGHLLAKGGDLKRTLAELFGRETGYCHGRGGSMHVSDVQLGILGANGIVAAGTVIAVGAGLSAQYRGTDQIVACFFGDGASNQGMFHESANMAAVWKLPVLYVCENNGFGEFTPRHLHQTVERVADRAAGYGMPGVTVDGDDVVAVYEAARDAVARVRDGGGPMLLECVTHRWRGHYEGDPQVYRQPEELESLEDHCPIRRFKARLIDERVITEADYEAIETRVRRAIDEAVDYARESPEPDPETLAHYTYAI